MYDNFAETLLDLYVEPVGKSRGGQVVVVAQLKLQYPFDVIFGCRYCKKVGMHHPISRIDEKECVCIKALFIFAMQDAVLIVYLVCVAE
jgi:hypothetical protein